jgi:carboxymethylenebutenolidase
MIHGTLDNHVPPEGRDLIRKTLRDKGIVFGWYEPAGAQRKSLNLHISNILDHFANRIW